MGLRFGERLITVTNRGAPAPADAAAGIRRGAGAPVSLGAGPGAAGGAPGGSRGGLGRPGLGLLPGPAASGRLGHALCRRLRPGPAGARARTGLLALLA